MIKNYHLLLLLIIFTFQTSYSQTEKNIDLLINEILYNQNENVKNTLDLEVKKAIELLDSKIDSIVKSHYNFSHTKYTIIQPVYIEIRDCLKKDEFIKATINLNEKTASSPLITYSELWKKVDKDSTKYISTLDSYSNEISLPDNYYQLKTKQLNPLLISSELDLNHLVFYDSQINNRIKEALKNNKKIRREIIAILEQDVTNFNEKTKKIDSQPIRLSYVIKDCSDKSYIGIDIYGSHFLISLNTNKFKILDKQKLWAY